MWDVRRNGAAGREAERAVGERSAAAGGSTRGAVPDPELVERARRRRFPAEYKLRILREADACTRSGETGALLRREGLYSSHLSAWRKQRDRGALVALRLRSTIRRMTYAPVIAVAMDAWWVNEQSEPLEELQRGERESGAGARCGMGETIDDALASRHAVPVSLEPFEGEWGTGNAPLVRTVAHL